MVLYIPNGRNKYSSSITKVELKMRFSELDPRTQMDQTRQVPRKDNVSCSAAASPDPYFLPYVVLISGCNDTMFGYVRLRRKYFPVRL